MHFRQASQQEDRGAFTQAHAAFQPQSSASLSGRAPYVPALLETVSGCDFPPLCPSLQVSLSAMAFLFSELVQYNQTRVNSITDLEQRYALSWASALRPNCLLANVAGKKLTCIPHHRLEEAGYGVGTRVLELLITREKVWSNPTRRP